jgi:hypothetical protein
MNKILFNTTYSEYSKTAVNFISNFSFNSYSKSKEDLENYKDMKYELSVLINLGVDVANSRPNSSTFFNNALMNLGSLMLSNKFFNAKNFPVDNHGKPLINTDEINDKFEIEI